MTTSSSSTFLGISRASVFSISERRFNKVNVMQRLSRNSSYIQSHNNPTHTPTAKSIIMRTKWHPTLHHQRKSTTNHFSLITLKKCCCFFYLGVRAILARSRSCCLEFYWNWIQFPVRLDNKLLEFCIYFWL